MFILATDDVAMVTNPITGTEELFSLELRETLLDEPRRTS